MVGCVHVVRYSFWDRTDGLPDHHVALSSTHLVDSIDGAWADVLWEYEKTAGGDCVIDDEFMRYLTFVIDVCEWRDGAPDRRWRDKSRRSAVAD